MTGNLAITLSGVQGAREAGDFVCFLGFFLFVYLFFLIDVGLSGCNMEVGVGSRLWMASWDISSRLL